jgi:hypothetical protein
MTLAIMGASFGAIIGVPLLLYMIDRLGLRTGLFTAGASSALVLLPLIAIVLRYRSPADLGFERDGDLPGADQKISGATPFQATQGNQRILFWTATTGFALGLLAQNGFIAHHVALSEPLLGKFGAGWLVSATGIVTLVGRLYLAKIVDEAPVRRLACQAMVAQLIALLLIGFYPSTTTLIAASLVYGVAIGHVTTLSPILFRREFVQRRSAKPTGRPRQSSSSPRPAVRLSWGTYTVPSGATRPYCSSRPPLRRLVAVRYIWAAPRDVCRPLIRLAAFENLGVPWQVKLFSADGSPLAQLGLDRRRTRSGFRS